MRPTAPSQGRPWAEVLFRSRTQAFLLLALASLWIFARLGQGHLANYDDCYYAEKANKERHAWNEEKKRLE